MSSGISDVLTWKSRDVILNQYIDNLAKACRILKVHISSVSYSEPELRRALDESDVDLKAMFERRSRSDGISIGKIAGILAYRLSRFKVVHLEESAHGLRGAFIVQDVAALLLVEALIIRVELPSGILLELAYQMSRRHANQETLGLVFDMMVPVAG